MEEKYNWNLKEIFTSKEDFEKTKMAMLEELEEISKFKGNLCESSNSLYQCYKIYETALEKLDQVKAQPEQAKAQEISINQPKQEQVKVAA